LSRGDFRHPENVWVAGDRRDGMDGAVGDDSQGMVARNGLVVKYYYVLVLKSRIRLRVGIGFWEVLTGKGAEFAADDVGRKAGTEEAAVEGSELLVIDPFACIGAAIGAQLALDTLADDGGLVGVLGGFFKGGFDVTVGDTAGT